MENMEIENSTKPKEKYPSNWSKTLVIAAYAIFCIVTMSTAEVMANDKVPPQYINNKTTAFWDIAWIVLEDYCPKGCKAAFKITELGGLTIIVLAFIHMLWHKHAAIILRRFFFLLGTAYFYRIVTVPVNVLLGICNFENHLVDTRTQSKSYSHSQCHPLPRLSDAFERQSADYG